MRFSDSPIHGTVIGGCKMLHGQIILGKCGLKQTCFSQPEVWSYHGTHVHETCSEKGDTGCGEGLAWTSGLCGILALLSLSNQTLQQSVYHRRALWTLCGPSLSCQQSLLPGHERTSLFSGAYLIPNGLLAPPIILWVLLQKSLEPHLCPRFPHACHFRSWLVLIWSIKLINWGFPGRAVVRNPPANAGDTGSSPGLGRSHMPRSN